MAPEGSASARDPSTEGGPPFSRAVLIFNPAAGKAPAMAAERMQIALRARVPDLPVRLEPTAYAGHARILARAAFDQGRGTPLLISVSGDGGYSDVVNGVMEDGRRAVCAVMGAGNANDHRRSTRTEPLVDAIERGQVRRIDLLRIRVGEGTGHWTQWAHSYIGFGLTPRMAIGIERGVKGRFSELVSVARVLRTLAPIEIIRENGSYATLDSLLLANITGVAKYGKIASASEPDDGKFEVLVLPHAAKWRIALMALRAVTIGLDPQESVQRFSFMSSRTIPIQVDGEVLKLQAGQPVVVESIPLSLTTLG